LKDLIAFRRIDLTRLREKHAQATSPPGEVTFEDKKTGAHLLTWQ
jgi:hypothetical protein